ncbi:MAG: hypothetical protein HAW59_00015, partial [Betaproteobacteria bacterium]|nr:hypothetical protein [Betaproteobacteria bacterium]
MIGISGNLAVLTASVTQTTGRHALFYGVRLGTEQVENPTRYLYPHAPALRLTTRNIVVTVGVQSGPVATLGIENIDNRGDVSHYNYSLRNPSNLSEFGKIAISSIIVPIPGFVGSMTVFFLQLTAPLENVTVSEIEVVAVHPQVRRTLVATVRVRALAPLGINIAPEDSTATLLALELPDNNLFDVTVSGGSTPYTVSLLNAPAEVTLKETLVTVARAGAAVDITITTYQISLASAFAQPGEHVFNLTVRDDGRQRSAQRLSQRFVITVTPLPFTISLSQDSAAVRLTTAASAPFVLGTMTATGGRPPYVYQIDNNFFGALSVNADGVIQQINSILPPRQHAFRVFVRDADGREMVRDYVIRSLDEPQVRVRMLNSRNFFNLGDIRLTAGVEHGVIATVEFMDRYAGVRYTQSIIPVGNAPPGVFDIVPGDGNIIGNGINLASVFLNAQAGRHQYTIAVAGDDGRTYVRAMNVLVVPTPPLQVLVPAGFGSARVRYDMLTVLATLSVSGGTGVNTYRIERNGAPPQLTVNAATGEIIMNPGAQFANEATATIIVESGELQQAVPFTVAVWGFQVWSEGDTRPVRAVRAAIPEISGVAGQEPAFSDFIGDAVNGIGAYPTGMERTDGRPHVRDTHWSISGSGSGIRRIRLRSAFFTLADPSNAEERVTMRIIAGPSGEDEIDHITVVARIVAGAFPEIHIQGESPLTQGDAAGSVFGTLRVRNVAAANTDVSDNYTYSIASRDDGNLPLGVDATSGVITVSAPLRTGVLRVNFVAEETTDNTRITLERDIAVLPPPPVVVILGETGIAAGSGVVGAIIGTVRASIFGGETEPRGDYSYSLTGGSGQLGVDESSGIISVIAAATTGNVLAFTVIAVHRGTGVRATLSRSITVDTPPILALTGANQLRDGIASLGRLRIISSVSNVDISSNWENFSVAIRGSGGPAGDLPIAVDATTGDVVVISTAVLVEGNNWNVRFTAEERIGVGVMTLDLDFEVLPPLPRLLIIGARDLQERADSIGAVFGTLRVSIAASGNLDGSADYTYSLANRGGGDLPLGVNADSGVVSVTADLSPGRLLVNFVAAARSGGETLTISRNISVLPSRLALAWTPGRFVIQGDPVGAIIGTLGVSGGAGIISGSTTPSLLGVSETGVVTVAAAIPNGNPISGTFMVEDAATGVGVTLNVQFTVFVPELTYFVPGAGGTQVRELRQDDYPGRFIGQLLFKITIIQTETAADGTTTTATVFVFPQTSNIRYSVADRNGLFGGNLGPFPLGINENNGALTIAHIIRDSISNLPLEFVAVAESGGVTTTITLNHDLPVGNSQTQRLGLTYTGATVINFE